MEAFELFQTAIGLSVGAGAMYYLKSIPGKIYKKIRSRLIYKVTIYQYDDLYTAFEDWLYRNHSKLYRDVEALSNVDSKNIVYRQDGDAFIINYKGKKIVISQNSEKLDKSGVSLKEMRFKKWVIMGIKARTQITQLLNDILQMYLLNQDEGKLRIFTHSTYGDWYYKDTKKVKPITDVIIDEDLKNDIINDVSEFISEEKKYIDLGIPYKRTYLLVGPPGTGKTTLALAIAQHLRRSVYYLSLNCFDDDSQLRRAFNDIKSESIILIEDIDRVFNGRENVESKITFSALLNNMDGALSKHSVITIVTTNHIEKLDPALIRPGRADLIREIPLATEREVSKYFTLFYEKPILLEFPGKIISMAQVQEICLRNKRDFPQAKSELYTLIKEKLNENTKHNNTLQPAGKS